MALAYFADGQWTRIPSSALNDVEVPSKKKKNATAVVAVPDCALTLRTGEYGRCMLDITDSKRPRCKFVPSSTARSCLSEEASFFVVSDAGATTLRRDIILQSRPDRESSFDAHHASAAEIVASHILEVAEEAGLKKVAVTCFLGAWGASVYVRRGDLPLDRVAAALTNSCAHVVIDDGTDGRPTMSNRFEIDSTFVEIKSDKWERATVESVAKELEVKQAEVIKFARLAAPKAAASAVGLLPHGLVTVGKNAGVTYAGSYHVWITMPYATGHAFDHNAFVSDHSALIRSFQWMEPLLLACMPADPRSPGSGSKFSRASMRSRLNRLSAFGISEMKPPEPRNVMCYDSLDALNAGHAPKIVKTDTVLTTATDGARINVLACQNVDRYGDRAPWTSGIGSFINNDGADVRFDTCSGCAEENKYGHFELDWGAAFVKTKDGISVASRRAPDKQFELNVEECKKSPVGVEFRVFDHFPGADKLYLSIVVLAAAASRAVAPSKPSDSSAWALQMREVALKGSRVPLSKEFWTELCAALGLTGVPEPQHAYEGMNAVLAALHDKYGSSSIARVFGYHERQVFPDVNYQAWKLGFLAKCASDDDLASKVARAIRVPSAASQLGPEWDNDRFLLMEYLRESAA